MAYQSRSLLSHSLLENTLNVDKTCLSILTEDEIESIADSETMFPNSFTNSVNNPGQTTNLSTDQLLLDSTQHSLNVPFTPQSTFIFLLVEQYLKAFGTLYLSFGIVIAVTFGVREVLVDASTANVVWNYIGIPYCVLLVHTVIVITVAKILVFRNTDCLEPNQSLSKILFYPLILLPACLSCFSVLFSLLRDTQYLNNCSVMMDILLPLFRFLFIMMAVMITADLINNKVSSASNTKFYLIYKFSAILTFITCINLMIFDFVNTETTYLQTFLSRNLSNPTIIYCNSNYTNNTFVDIEKITFSYLNVFSLIYSIMTIVFLLEPLKQLLGWRSSKHIQDNQPILNQPESSSHHQDNQVIVNQSESENTINNSRFIPKYLSIVIICSMIVFLFSSIIVILYIMANIHPDIKDKIILATCIILIPTFLISSFISQIMLSLLHSGYSLKASQDTPSVPTIIIWISLCGMLLTIIRNVNDNIIASDATDSVQKKLILILYIENMMQALLQAMTMDFVFQIDWSCRLARSKLNKIYYCCIPLIAMNTGCLISDYYRMTFDKGRLQRSNDTYHVLTWDLLSSFGNPLMILYRFSGALFIIIFTTGMRCLE